MLNPTFNPQAPATFGVPLNQRSGSDVFLIATLTLAEPNVLASFVFADRTDCSEASEYHVG